MLSGGRHACWAYPLGPEAGEAELQEAVLHQEVTGGGQPHPHPGPAPGWPEPALGMAGGTLAGG